MMCRWRTSRTRKRSSDSAWSQTAVSLAILGLLVICSFAIRGVTLTGKYGSIDGELPVVSAPVEDLSYHQEQEEPGPTLGERTPAVVLTTDAFYYGDLKSFSATFADSTDKRVIYHVDGEPQLPELVRQLTAFIGERSAAANLPIDRLLVLIPDGDIPMPIVIQVMAGLRRSTHIERVVLGGGIL